MLKFQTFKKFKLPIAINPLDYGKLLFNDNNLYVMWVSKTSIAIIKQLELINHVKFFVNGVLIFEFKDHKVDDNTFVRSINNLRFEFKDNTLTSVTSNNIVVTIVLKIFKNTLNQFIYDSYIIISVIKILIFKIHFVKFFIFYELFGLFLIWLICFKVYPETSMAIAGVLTGTGNSNKIKYRSNWNSIFYKIENQIFSITLIEFYFNKFWKIVSPKIFEGCHIFLILKVQFEDNSFHTIGKLIKLDKNNYESFITQIANYIEVMGEYYKQSPIDKIIFSYGFKRGEISENISKSEQKLMYFKDMKLVISTDPNDFGKILRINEITNGKLYLIQDHLDRIIEFKEFEKENLVEYFKNRYPVLIFKDIKLSEGKFLRILGKKSLLFENGNKSLELLTLNTPFISKLKKDKIEINKFITLDIETLGSTDLTPYLISFYDGNITKSFYLEDYNSIDSMMEACFKKLFIRKYNNYQIYIHNLTKFDIIFLLKYLIKHVEVVPLIHNGRIIQLTINYGKDNQYLINIKDSYLILLSGLDKLSKSFKIENPKTIFPHKFVNKNNLNYIGEVPSIDNFFNISKEDYLNYKKYYSFWNLKTEAIKYCEIDCIALYQIILKFSSLIFSLFSKSVHKYPTLPSIAFAIFRSCFMEEENIPKLTGNIEKDIRKGYTGGSTDMFIPYGKNIKCYDVNSLYPSVMINKDMPIGKINKFVGDITKFDSNAFGFFYVKVNCPENIMHPILQIKHKINGSIKTISPVGTWYMWIFSEEMNNASKYGYTFEILEGYTFERGITFKDYIEFLYNLRSQYDRSNPLNLIAKILLNSLYGRFGMNQILIKYEIISKMEFNKISEDLISDFIEIDDQVLVGLKIEESEDSSNISLGIASAITSYARIFMSQFKNNPKIILYYTDTDSAYVSFDSELDPSLIDPIILGKLKLEHICEEAVFLGPKIYCLKTNKGLITKVKGLKDTSSLSFKDFNDLLIKNAYKIQTHEKWFRNLSKGKITIKEQLYKLIATDNKRKFIYENNKIIGTKSIKL